MRRINTMLLLVLIWLAIMNLARAEEATAEPSEGIRACTADELASIYTELDFPLRYLMIDLTSASSKSMGELAAEVDAQYGDTGI